ncbi:isoleucine-tRNA ligase [Puttea exsequens]|nr:isoleucine-tRNA ligase [Puttea exsequens]
MSWVKNTLHLPKSSFPARPVLADRPTYIRRCTDELYKWQQRRQTETPPFVLADGPPYANGDLHIGHALNKILKDVICRYQVSEGRRVEWLPGWDCHGLPIELKALHEHEGKSKDAINVRRTARKLARKTVQNQKKAFQQWAIMADWENPWTTEDKDFEVEQLRVFKTMVKKGLIYRQFKPVYWSPSSQTALAEAELEYRDDHVSKAAFIKFPLATAPPDLSKRLGLGAESVSAVIWTTTPWTLPANRAIGYHKDVEYIVVESTTLGRLLIAQSRLDDLEHHLQECLSILYTIDGQCLEGTTYRSRVFDRHSPVKPFLHADFVSETSGSGLIHLAPGHGKDDYDLCQSHNIEAFAPIDNVGCFTSAAYPEDPDYLTGKSVLSEGNEAVINLLSDHGRLLALHDYEHNYPYDWRTKQPVIVRATKQWFANVGRIQGDALNSLEAVTFIPAASKNRLQSFVRNRTEWCIARQRAWGVPIPAIYCNDNDDAVLTEESVSHVISVIKDRGLDAWWTDDESDPAWIAPYLLDGNDKILYRRGKDTMDVWFDSGTTWTQTKGSSGLRPHVASCYIEGTDQHRGWFQSSLLTHVASQNGGDDTPSAPFETLVTHGFILDHYGRKMSKSIGNVVSPNEIINGTLLPPTKRKVGGKVTEVSSAMGPDALRLWVAGCDYSSDVKVSTEVLQAVTNSLSKYRVTFKMLLGILRDFDPSSFSTSTCEIGLRDTIALWRLSTVMIEVRRHYECYELNKATAVINSFVSNDLSSLYFEMIKDAAYCGTEDERLRVQKTLYRILNALQQMLYPVTPLLVEEVWQYTPEKIKAACVIPPAQRTWEQLKIEIGSGFEPRLGEDFPKLRSVLAAVNSAQEVSRTEGLMRDSLQSWVWLDCKSEEACNFFDRYSSVLESLLVVSNVRHGRMTGGELQGAAWSRSSDVNINGGQSISVRVHVYEPQQAKCIRCWRYKANVDAVSGETICERCEGARDTWKEDEARIALRSRIDTH